MPDSQFAIVPEPIILIVFIAEHPYNIVLSAVILIVGYSNVDNFVHDANAFELIVVTEVGIVNVVIPRPLNAFEPIV